MAKTKKAKGKNSAGKKRTASGKRASVKAKATKKNAVSPTAGRRTAPSAGERNRSSLAQSARGTRTNRLRGGAPARRTDEVNSGSTRQGPRGVGPDAGGQSGDLQGLSRAHDVDSESVEELMEEGQALEAGVISGVEEADEDNAEDSEVPDIGPSEEKIPSYRKRRSL